MKDTNYTVYQIAKKLKISRSNIQQYLDRGFIHPSIKTAAGKGTRNFFSLEDIYRIRIFQSLAQIGLLQKEAADYAQSVDLAKVGNKGINWIMISYENGVKKICHTHFGAIQAKVLKEKNILVVINCLKIKEEINALFLQ